MKEQNKNSIRNKIGCVGGIVSFAICYAASSAPIPLYTDYGQLIGLSNADLSFSSALYFIGTVMSLLLLARLSDYWGRKPLIIIALLLAMVGCTMFAFMQTPWMFLLGRFVQGMSCGLGASCMSAYIVDMLPQSGAIAVSSAPMLGLAIGSMGAGLLVQYMAVPLSTIFLLLLAMLLISMVLIFCGQETVTRKSGWVASLRPSVSAPIKVRPFLPAAFAVFVGTWAIGGLYQAFSSAMETTLLGVNNVVVAAIIFAVLQAPNVIGSKLTGHLESKAAQRLGMTAFLVSTIGMVFFLQAKWLIPFLVTTACIGISWGLAYTGSMQAILSKITASERAGVLSMIYIVSYSGAAVPSLVIGKLFSSQSLSSIVMEYAGVVVVVWILTFFLTKKETFIHSA